MNYERDDHDDDGLSRTERHYAEIAPVPPSHCLHRALHEIDPEGPNAALLRALILSEFYRPAPAAKLLPSVTHVTAQINTACDKAGFDDAYGNRQVLIQAALHWFCQAHDRAQYGGHTAPMFAGAMGTGKSAAARIFASQSGCTIITVEQMGEWYRVDTRKLFNRCYDCGDLIIDDVGAESHRLLPADVLASIISRRHAMWESSRGSKRTGITTNLMIRAPHGQAGKPTSIEACFGSRTARRVNQMCELFQFGGPDRSA